MSTPTLPPPKIVVQPPERVSETYLNIAHGMASWLLTKDHKRIGMLYLMVVTVMFFLGGFAISRRPA